MLHKPKGYVVTRLNRPESENSPGSKTVYSLLPTEFHAQGWVPVGRLDKDSSGLLLFVREGPLVYLLQTPGNLQKVYEVWVKGLLEAEHLQKVLQGVQTPLGILKAKVVEVLGVMGTNTLVKIVLDEGKNRQIRRIFASMKNDKFNKYFKVLGLHRVSIGSVDLDVEPGQWRFLSKIESEQLLRIVPKNEQRPQDNSQGLA
jgi:23S rRNA pseudouridine2605 synthase